jgi:hypothetical protein
VPVEGRQVAQGERGENDAGGDGGGRQGAPVGSAPAAPSDHLLDRSDPYERLGPGDEQPQVLVQVGMVPAVVCGGRHAVVRSCARGKWQMRRKPVAVGVM